MNLKRINLLFLSCLMAFSGLALGKDKVAEPIEGVNNDLDVSYVPHRLTGVEGADQLIQMNVHWNDSDEPHPCVIMVHGGGYGAGDKDDGQVLGAAEYLLNNGYTVANVNYLLGQNNFPQVYWDFKSAIRYLRMNAEKYNIDPDRFGAWGFSAGGWLSSASTFSHPEDLYGVNSMPSISHNDRRKKREQFEISFDNPRPNYGEYSSALQVIHFDFQHFKRLDSLHNDNPVISTYVGVGGVPKWKEEVEEAGIEYQTIEVLDEEGSNSVHVPKLDKKCMSQDGTREITLLERAGEWFDTKLKQQPRAPAVEFRPNLRYFENTVTVTPVVPSEGIQIHYTTDGSDPTPDSPVFSGELELTESTVIKAITTKQGFTNSGITIAHFTKGGVPPEIKPVPVILPKAKVGEDYEFVFETEGSSTALWNLEGSPLTEPALTNDPNPDYTGLWLKPDGVLSGIPSEAGIYTFQVQAVHQLGQVGDAVTVVLPVDVTVGVNNAMFQPTQNKSGIFFATESGKLIIPGGFQLDGKSLSLPLE